MDFLRWTALSRLARGLCWGGFLPLGRANEQDVKVLPYPFVLIRALLFQGTNWNPFNPVTLFNSCVRSFVSVKCRGHDGRRVRS